MVSYDKQQLKDTWSITTIVTCAFNESEKSNFLC